MLKYFKSLPLTEMDYEIEITEYTIESIEEMVNKGGVEKVIKDCYKDNKKLLRKYNKILKRKISMS